MKKPLSRLKAACYYGCLLTRPPEVVKFDDSEQPSSMEAILAALGGKDGRLELPHRVLRRRHDHGQGRDGAGLAHKILADAQQHGANCLVVACPMCHVNLDMKQARH